MTRESSNAAGHRSSGDLRSMLTTLTYQQLRELEQQVAEEKIVRERMAVDVLSEVELQDIAQKFNIQINRNGVTGKILKAVPPPPPANSPIKVVDGTYVNTETGDKWTPSHGRPPKWAQAYRKQYEN